MAKPSQEEIDAGKKIKQLGCGETYSGITNQGEYNNIKTSRYSARMSTPRDVVLIDPNVTDYLINYRGIIPEDECDFAPASRYNPDQLWTQLARLCEEQRPDVQFDEHLKAGIDMAYSVFARPSYAETLDTLKTKEDIRDKGLWLDKSSGLPHLGKKGEHLDSAYTESNEVLEGKKAPEPCIAFARTQHSTGDEGKTRLVWGFPLEMTILESRFARPLIDMFLKWRTTMAFGIKDFRLGAQLCDNLERKNGGKVYSIDYSKFDQTISAELINMAFKVLGTWFSEEDKDMYGWDTIVSYFITTPIVMPDGNLYTGKRHGVPSGSFFTQLIDSIVNTALIGSMWSRFKQHIHWTKLYVLGDDSIFPMYGNFDLNDIKIHLGQYGIIVNSEKSTVNRLEFLSADWSSGFADRDLGEIIQRAVFPETWRSFNENLSKYQRAEMVLRALTAQYGSARVLIGTGMLELQAHAWRNYLSQGYGDISEDDQYKTGFGTYKAEIRNRFSRGSPRKLHTIPGMRMQ